MEKVRKVVKKYYLRQIMTYWLACWMFFGLPAQVAMAATPVVTNNGGAAITQSPGPDWTNVLVNKSHTVIDWSNFNTVDNELMAFEQGSLVNSAVLNRISGPTTNFNGDLTGAGMRIFMVNPAGIVFGPTATVNVAQLVASALNMDPDDFLDDNMVFQGGDGIVSNFGTINATDSVYLLGGDVINNGTISSPGDVVLVATMNDKVIITKEGSDVLVEFAAPDLVATSDVQNGHDIGFGDIWSYALVEARQITAKAEEDITIADSDMFATDYAASHAVAEIDLIAGGDVTIEDSAVVGALAVGNDEDGAFATTTIDAGSNVYIRDSQVWAEAVEASLATATVDITANDGAVEVTADESDAEVFAGAFDSKINEAFVNIMAKSENVQEPGNANVLLEALNGGEVYVGAEAERAGLLGRSGNSNTAAVTINADYDVDLNAAVNGDVYVEAIASNDVEGEPIPVAEKNKADIIVEAGGHVEIIASSEESDAEIYAEASYGNDNTATIDIDATGDLNVNTEGFSAIEAYALDTYSGDAIAAVTVDAANVYLDDSQIGAEAYAEEGLGNATSTIDITMTGSDVIVDNDSWIWTYAETYDGAGDAVSEIAIQDAETVTVDNHSGIYADAETGGGSGNSIAAVDVDATGDVLVNGGDGPGPQGGVSYIYSYAYSDDSGDAAATTTVDAANITVTDNGEIYAETYAAHSLSNATSATVITTTSSEVLVEDDSAISSYAYTENDAGNAKATTTVDAGGVTVVDDSEIYAEAYAHYGSGTASGTVDIDATGNVLVNGGDLDCEEGNSYVWSYAYSYDLSGDATALTTVDAANITVADDGDIDAYAEAYYSLGNATATTEITTTSSEVLVEDDSVIYSYAYTDDAGNAKAETTVDAGGVTVADDSEIYAEAYVYDGSGKTEATVDILADDDVTIGDNTNIEAVAEGDGVDDAIASVTITAGGKVTAINTDDDDEDTIIRAYAVDGLNNYADVKIDADGDVELKSVDDNVRVHAIAGPDPDDDEGEWLPALLNEATVEIDAANVYVTSVNNDVEVLANASTADENKADVKITTTENVKLEAGSQEAKIFAFAYDGDDNTANINVDAEGSVDVLINDYSGDLGWNYAKIAAEAWDGGDNSANVTITAGTVDVISNAYGGASVLAGAYEGVNNNAFVSVTTDGTGEKEGDINVISYSNDGGPGWAEIVAEAELADNSNSAAVTLNAARDVDVEAYNGGEAYIEAIATNDDESNTATINVVAGGTVLVEADDNSEAFIYAEASYGFDNTATINVTANDGDVDVDAWNDSDAYIEAEAYNAENSNTATVNITAKKAEVVEPSEPSGDGDGDGSVYVDADNDSSAYIGAFADEDDETNTATVDITADGNVEVTADDDSEAEILAETDDGGINTSAITVNAKGNVLVEAGYKSEAVIRAEADDAAVSNSATVAITTTGTSGDGDGDVDVIADESKSHAKVQAEATDSDDNSAGVTINAAGDVSIVAVDGDVSVEAIADSGESDAVLNHADIQITGSSVSVVSENSGGWIDFPDDALVYAYAHDGEENMAHILMTANDTEGGNVTIESIGQKGDDVLVKAEAKNGDDNTATVGISATGSVNVKAYGMFDEAIVQAQAWNDIEIDPEYETVVIQEAVYEGEDLIQEEITEEVANEAVEGLTNTAFVGILADENVNIEGSGSGDAAVKALAYNEIEVDIHNPDNEVTVNLTVADLENKAQVTISGDGEGVFVNADGLSSKVGVSAEAYNELEVDQHTGGKEWIPDPEAKWWEWWKGHWEYLDAYAADLNLDVSGLLNRSDIGIQAINGNVEVGSEECWFGTVSKVGAKAYNDFDIDLYAECDAISTGNLTLNGLTNYAVIDVAAGYDVLVEAGNGAESGIFAEAFNVLDPDEDADGTITVENLINVSDVDVAAAEGSVEVIANCEDDTSDAYIYADAFNDVPKPENGPLIVTNTATVDVTAGEDVKVMAFDGGYAEIAALAEQGVDITAGVTIKTLDGKVLVHAIDADAAIMAEAYGGDDNVATIDIDAVGGDVAVVDIGEGGDRSAEIMAIAEDAINSNTADIQITATATTSKYDEEVDGGEILTYVDVEGGDVKVVAKDGGHAEITAYAADAEAEELKGDSISLLQDEELEIDPTSNTANVTIRTYSAEGVDYKIVEPPVSTSDEPPSKEPPVYEAFTYIDGGDVIVEAQNGSEAAIQAVTMDSGNNDSDVLICAEGEVEVIDENSRLSTAKIISSAQFGAINDAYTAIRGLEGISVLGFNGKASIGSEAYDAENSNTAYTLLCAEDIELEAINGGVAKVTADAAYGEFNTADIDLLSKGEVTLLAGNNSEAKVRAEAKDGYENNSHIGIWADDDVEVIGIADSMAKIEAKAKNGYDNDAEVLVVAGGDIEVTAIDEGKARIQATANFKEGGSNKSNAYVGLWADGDVLVNGFEDGEARVLAEAADGIDNTADVAVCAEGDVIVAAGFNIDDVSLDGIPEGTGGSATIKAVAQADMYSTLVPVIGDGDGDFDTVSIGDGDGDGDGDFELINTTATANVKVVSHNGGVAVIDITEESQEPTALIEAEASGAYYNTADVGVAAGGELMEGSLTEGGILYGLFNDITDTEFELNDDLGLGVLVAGLGYGSKAGIFAYAHDGVENTADVVVCAPETVGVVAYADNGQGPNPFAQIKARAGAYGPSDDYLAANTATTQVYAGDVGVALPTIARGRGIWASAVDTDGSPHVDKEFLMTAYDGDHGTGEFVWTIDNFDEEGDDSATLIIRDYGVAEDCPTCDPRPVRPDCPDCDLPEDEKIGPFVAPLGVAPLPALQEIVFGQGGCPALMAWLANEVGVAVDVQVFLAGAFVSSTDCQPCESAAKLKRAATALADEDGSRMAAMNQVFAELVDAGEPFTPEDAASFATNTGAQYALAREYIDAFVQYIAILNTEMGSPVADSVAYVMEKYGSDVSGNDDMAGFLATRIQSGETYAQ